MNYTVVYWQENADDDGYSYVETVTKQGYAGSEATFDEKDYAHFVLGANSEHKFITGDSSTIVNVYYQRQTYTLTFTTGSSTLTCGKREHTHNGNCYEWVLVCEKWHWHNESCYERRLTCNQEEHTHTDACYASDSGVIYTITAKYDADISHIWSDPAITAYSDEGYVWKSSVTEKYYSFLEKMPGQNITLTATKWEGNKYTWYYYLEVLPGQNTTGLTLRTDGGRTYYLYNTISPSQDLGRGTKMYPALQTGSLTFTTCAKATSWTLLTEQRKSLKLLRSKLLLRIRDTRPLCARRALRQMQFLQAGTTTGTSWANLMTLPVRQCPRKTLYSTPSGHPELTL